MSIIFNISFFFLIITSVILISNVIYSLRKKTLVISKKPKISILIPCRNESKRILNLIKSIKEVDYTNYECILIDDQSTDDTLKIVQAEIRDSERFAIYRGEELPEGWLGKNWACHQAQLKAKGEYLLFLDADVILEKRVLTEVISIAEGNNLDLLSLMPKQVVRSIAEALAVPLLNWGLLLFLPLGLVRIIKNKNLSAACGQFLLFKKSSYEKIGGHDRVRNNIVEDLAFGRLIKEKRLREQMIVSDKVSCRMYSNYSEVVQGFTKNYFAASNMSPISFFLTNILFLIVFLSPFILVFWKFGFIYLILIILVQRIIISFLSQQNIVVNILLAPLQHLMQFFIAIKSYIHTKKKRRIWKGRVIKNI